MKLAKSLTNFANTYNLQIAKVRFHANGKTSIGFDIMDGNKILYTLEPYRDYSSKYKWMVKGLENINYLKNISDAIHNISVHRNKGMQSTIAYSINENPDIIYDPSKVII